MTSTVRAFFLASLVTGLIACSGSASTPSGASPDALGFFAVGHASFTAVDPARSDDFANTESAITFSMK